MNPISLQRFERGTWSVTAVLTHSAHISQNACVLNMSETKRLCMECLDFKEWASWNDLQTTTVTRESWLHNRYSQPLCVRVFRHVRSPAVATVPTTVVFKISVELCVHGLRFRTHKTPSRIRGSQKNSIFYLIPPCSPFNMSPSFSRSTNKPRETAWSR
jgi:hypothetical protein